MRNIITLITVLCLSTVQATYIINVDEAFDIESLITGYGYPFEKHTVTTDDGYILEIHRVQYGTDSDSNTDGRPPVLVMHGLLGCSADFFHIGVGKSLPLRLADVGYDVWIGNNRGNSYGKSNKNINPSDDTFWDFSFDEIGLHDTPAIIDYILSETGATQLSYVGHSVGATQFFILASTKPEYNEKVNIMTALAPVVYVGDLSSPLIRLIDENVYVAVLAVEKYLKINEFLKYDSLFKLFCSDENIQEICAVVLFLLQGFDSNELDRKMIPLFLQSFPAGTSIKQVNHFLQNRISGDFKQFDYGKVKNYEVYKSITPPSYDLSKVSTPVGVFYGKNDFIVVEKDINRLVSELPNVAITHQIEYPQFDHLDFLVATDVDSFANFHIINTLNKVNNLPEVTTTSTTTISTTPSNPTEDPTKPTDKPSSSNTIFTTSYVALSVQVLFGLFTFLLI